MVLVVAEVSAHTGSALPAAGQVDESKLPPAATVPVDFAKDIKPILENSCLRCHGPEKPKSGFRLDNPAAALKGGENGVDILPGKSAESPLVHYVARLVPDLEMPPTGKGPPLSQDQIALLRAWIDQGASWDNAALTNLFDLSISPAFGWTSVSGDKNKFREHYWRQIGFDGGVENFELFERSDPDTKITAAGHAWRDDYRVILDVDRNELGFVHTGWEQYRKYYDDTGSLHATPPANSPLSSGRQLYLDNGKAWIDFGLTLPRWPRMVLGYEYDYRRGEEAITSYQSDQVKGEPRNVAPATKQINEDVHVIKFDLDAEIKGVSIEDRFRGEFYKLNTHYTNLAARGSVAQDASDANHYFQGANGIRLEKQFKEWLLGSGGYFYSKLNADDSFNNRVFQNRPFPASANIRLERESHVFNLNGLLGPFDGLTVSAGAQSEWTRQKGTGKGILNGITFQPSRDLGLHPTTLASDYDQNTVLGTVGLRYSKIPFTSLFADARWQEETIGQSDSDIQSGAASFVENPSFSSRMTDFRAGFDTSPWQGVSMNAHYRRYENDSRYDTNQPPQPAGGYPGLISWRDLLTDEVEAKLVFRPRTWLKTTLSYQFVTTDYKQRTRPAYDSITNYSPGGFVLAGEYDSHIYSLGATLTPFRRLSLSGTFSYQNTVTKTESAGLIPPYKGGVYSALVSGTYILNEMTDLLLNYSFSLADYAHDNSINPTGVLPLAIRYQQHALQAGISRRLNKRITTRLQYTFYYYDEPSAAHVNDYQAHSIFATLTFRLL